MDSSTPGFPVHHQLPELTQTHVHQVGDAIQLSHPLLSPSPALNPSQHYGLFQRVRSSHQVTKVLDFQLQHHSGLIPLGLTSLIFLQSKTLSRVFSNTTVPGSGRSPGEGNGNLLQYSCLGNLMDRGAWWGTVYGIAKSWTQLSN